MQDNDRGTPEQLRADALIQAAQATLKKDVKGKRNIARSRNYVVFYIGRYCHTTMGQMLCAIKDNLWRRTRGASKVPH